MGYLLGIDAGTSTVKAALYDPDRGLVAETRVECPATYEKGDMAEIDMGRYWEACTECLASLSGNRAAGGLRDVAALAVSSQGVTFVPVDRDGRELRPGIVYYDSRAVSEAVELNRRFSAETIYEITGQPVSPETFEAPKLLWLRNHEPDLYGAIHKILLVHDYLVYKLTGRFACVPPLVSSSLLFDVRTKRWWDDMLTFLDLSPDRLPPLFNPGELIGTVSVKASAETGLPAGALVAAGAIDQVCGMTGVGNICPGIISESTGSVLAVHAVSERFFNDRSAGIHHFTGGVGGTYALIGISPTAGSAFNWFKDTFCMKELDDALRTGTDVFTFLTGLAESIPSGSGGLVMLPYLSGKGSPHPDPLYRGFWFGMKLHHTKGHFVRSLLESVAFILRSICDMFRDNGFEVTEIRSFGGGSRSALWNRIKADVCGLPIRTSAVGEPGCLGAAILAGVGSGIFGSIHEGCGLLVRDGDVYYPEDRNVRIYDDYYTTFRHWDETVRQMQG